MRDPIPPPEPEALLAHAEFVRGLARRLVLDEASADDLVQGTWLAALDARMPPRRSVRGWLGGITRNLARMWWRGEVRRDRRERAVARPEGSESAADTAARMEEQTRLVRAVSALDEPGRTAVVLRYLDGLSRSAIAAKLDVPVRTVESRLRRALETLRARLDGEHGGDRRAWSLALLPLALPGAAAAVGIGGSGVAGGVVMGAKAKLGLIVAGLLVAGFVGWGLVASTADVPGPGPVPVTEAAPPAPEPEEPAPATEPEPPPPEPDESEPPPPPPPEEPPVPPPPPPEPDVPSPPIVKKDPPIRIEPPVKPEVPANVPDQPVPPLVAQGPVPPGMAEVQGGTFEMGMPVKALKKRWKNNERVQEFLALETPAHEVSVGEFLMDRYEVTNAQYLAFLNAAHKTVRKVGGKLNTLAGIAVDLHGSEADEEWWKAIYHMNWKALGAKDLHGRDPDPAWATRVLPEGLQLVVYDLPIPKHWLDHGTIPPGLEDHPVRYMSWDHANLFARWAGKHLPTEAEWERAARGPENFVYPWGGDWREFDWERKELRLNWALLPANHPARDPNPAILTTSVGSFEVGKSGFGMFDMLGNVWEWTDDWLSAYPGSRLEPQDWWNEAKVVRGGAYSSTGILLRTTFRTGGDGRDLIFRPKDSFESFGFRCARWPVPGADRAYQAWRTMADAKLIPEDDRRVIEFSRFDGIGVEATRFDVRENHVYVVGRSRAIAILPRAKLPLSIVRDLDMRAEKSRHGLGIVVGLLTTDLDLSVYRGGEADESKASAPAGDYVLAYHDGRLQLLKGDIMGYSRVGYLTARRENEPSAVVSTGTHERNASWTAIGLDQAHVRFAVDRRMRGRTRFVFQAVITTAENGVLSVDWQDRR